MRKIGLFVTASALAYLAIYAFGIGLDGMRTNFKGNEVQLANPDSIIQNPNEYCYSYVQIIEPEIENVYQANEKEFTYFFNVRHTDTTISEVMSVATMADPYESTMFKGILKPITKIFDEEACIVLNLDPETIILTDEVPRDWYWNLLIMFIPTIYIVAFLGAIINIFKKKAIGIPDGKY